MKKLLTISIALFILTLTTNEMFAQNWNFQTIDQTLYNDIINATDIKLDDNSFPHVLYLEGSTYTNCYYAKWNGIAWIIESIPDNNHAGHAHFCLDPNNNPHIIHKYDYSSNKL